MDEYTLLLLHKTIHINYIGLAIVPSWAEYLFAARSIADKEGVKADTEAKLLKDEEEKTATTKEAMATHQYLGEVHADCDWLNRVSIGYQ